MKHYRLKFIKHNQFFIIQERIGLFSWKTVEITKNSLRAAIMVKELSDTKKKNNSNPIFELTSKNEAFIIFPTIAFVKDSVGLFWLRYVLIINL
jgi:hypothetical protein